MSKNNSLNVFHIIKKSEIDYGILNIRQKDGTKNILKDLPERFTIIIKNKKIENRKINAYKIWIGFDIMEQFEVGQIVEITKKENIIFINNKLD
jgi:hypothetical protein